MLQIPLSNIGTPQCLPSIQLLLDKGLAQHIVVMATSFRASVGEALHEPPAVEDGPKLEQRLLPSN